MKKLIFVMCFLAIFSGCKKEHVEPVGGVDITKLPKKVVTYDSKDDAYKIQLYTYNSQGLVTKICMYDSLNPQSQDSIIYLYNFRNQLEVKRTYINNFVASIVYAFDPFGKLDAYYDLDTMYIYHYNTTGEVDYIIKSNYARSYQDSIQMSPGSAVTYLDKGNGVLGASHDYRDSIVEHFFNTDNGVYEDRGLWVYYNPVWGDQLANTTVCIDKEIKFQDEVAYTIVPIGQAGYFNMYARTTPYKYATYAEHIVGPLLTSQHYEASYTFDIYGRLTSIDAEYLGPIDTGVLNPPSIPAIMRFTKTIYY